MKTYYVYIMTNKKYGTLYIGMTNNLVRRVWKHKTGEIKGFTQKHQLKKLVYFDYSNDVWAAIQREKNMKEWKRQWMTNSIKVTIPYGAGLASGVGVRASCTCGASSLAGCDSTEGCVCGKFSSIKFT